MSLFKKTIKVVTHSGDFHADDVFACATLSLWAEKEEIPLKIIRSRDSKIIEIGDIVVDVGNVYDPEKNRFDHHQTGRAGTRADGIPYASFGLVWKKYGEEVCGSKEVAERIDQKLVAPIDAQDNGFSISESLYKYVDEYLVVNMIKAFRTTWKDPISLIDKKFEEVVDFAISILKAEIHKVNDLLEGEKLVLEEIKKQNNPEILILNDSMEWETVVCKVTQIKFVVYLDTLKNGWCVEGTRDDLFAYDTRALFPKEWWGKRDEKLSEVCGIKDAIFCHSGGWFAATKSKEGAIEMAKKALVVG